MTGRWHGSATAIGVLAALYSATFFVGALLHAGVAIPLGLAVLAEPVIVPAVIVESLCGAGLAVAAYAVLTRKTWAWLFTFAAHVFALGGILLGIAALAAGGGPHTALNDTYHRVMAILLAGSVALLLTPLDRAALGRAHRRPHNA
ncbi:MAG: hypothetical protein ACRDZ4_07890 [Egibacteraceae bacterium]